MKFNISILVGAPILALFSWWILWGTSAEAQSSAPTVSIVHTQCVDCKVWISSAPNGISGFIATFLEHEETDPAKIPFTFGGADLGDLVDLTGRILVSYSLDDLNDNMQPTTEPVLLFTYTGPVPALYSLRVDDDDGFPIDVELVGGGN